MQGLGSPFLARLAEKVLAGGVEVVRVNFCGGDPLFAGPEEQINYRGSEASLPGFYEHLIKNRRARGFVLFGDERPIHKPAIALAREKGLAVYVVEEGYIRPNWVTFEYMGTNANSLLPRDLEVLRALADTYDDLGNGPSLPPPMQSRVVMDLYHKGGNIFLGGGFPGYRTHRPDPMPVEIKGWLSRLARGPFRRQAYKATLDRYALEKPRYMLMPLQLNSDTQVRIHADVGGMLGFIETVLASHAAHAPADLRLLVKNHPLDNGVIDYRRLIKATAQRLGTQDRVDFVEGGDLTTLIDNAEGVVTVNSTVGLATLMRTKPLFVMGKALYRIEGLSQFDTLNTFWSAPRAPLAADVANLVKVIQQTMMVPGDLFTKEGIDLATNAAAAILLGHDPRCSAQLGTVQ